MKSVVWSVVWKEKMSGHLGKTLWAQLYFLLSYLPYFSQHPFRVHTICLLALMGGVVLAWYRRHISLIWQIIIVCFGGWLIFQHYHTFRGLGPGLSLLAFLVCVKTLELRHERDLFIFFFITTTLLVGHLLNISSFLGLIHFFACLAMMLLMMMCFHNRRRWRWPVREHFKVLGALYILAIPQAIFLFVFFPRFYVGHLQFPSVGAQSKLGFTDELRPGRVSTIVEDQSAIFRARFLSQSRPKSSELYWRGAVLQKTEGLNWDRGEAPVHEGFLNFYQGQASESSTISYLVDFATHETDVAFTLQQTFELTPRSRSRLSIKPGETFSLKPRSSQKISYEGRSLTQKTRPQEYGELDLAPYLQLPSDLPVKLEKYAHELRDEFSTGQAITDELMGRFFKQDFVYTLSPGPYLGEDAISEFFFDRKRGFCEHYSSVSALILRLAGVPARVVTGFQGGVYNDYGDYFIIRGEDAHAWIEVHLKDKGWVRYDPVSFIAPQRIELGASRYFQGLDLEDGSFNQAKEMSNQGPFWKNIRLRWDAWYYQMNQYFMSYDQESQKSFLSNLGLPQISPFQLLSATFGVVFLFGLCIFVLFSWPRKKITPERALWIKFFKFLEKEGIHRDDYSAPLDYRAKIIDKFFARERPRLEDVLYVFDSLLRLSYARRDKNSRELFKQVRQELKKLN